MQVTTLSNGMRVATESNPAAETATLGLWISSGSRYETDATNGAANLLEHVLFKGTKVRWPYLGSLWHCPVAVLYMHANAKDAPDSDGLGCERADAQRQGLERGG